MTVAIAATAIYAGIKFFGRKKSKKPQLPQIQTLKYDPEIVDLLFGRSQDLIKGRGKEDILGAGFRTPVFKVSRESLTSAGAGITQAAESRGLASANTGQLVKAITGESIDTAEGEIFSDASRLSVQRKQLGTTEANKLFKRQRRLTLARQGVSQANSILSQQARNDLMGATSGLIEGVILNEIKKKEKQKFLDDLQELISGS